MSFEGSTPAATLWLLTGDRPGEVAQQRVLAAACGLPWCELQVTRLRTAGGRPRFDVQALQAPWPRIAISFGKTLPAALLLRERSRGHTRLVHLGRARGVRTSKLDLLVPMPADRVAAAANVLRIRMPFNFPAPLTAEGDAQVTRLLAAGLPRPWTALIIGGATRQLRFVPAQVTALVRAVSARVRSRGGSLLLSSSPRTPPATVAELNAAREAPGEFYAYTRGDPQNPLAAYLQLADELIVTGDSASLIAECWRSGRPLWVAPLRNAWRQQLGKGLRALLPRRAVTEGWIAAGTDLNAWLATLVRDGLIGRFGEAEPWRGYVAAEDDDLARTVARIRALL